MTELRESAEPNIWPPHHTYAVEFTPNAKKASVFAFHCANDPTLFDWTRLSGHSKYLLPVASHRVFGITLPTLLAKKVAEHLETLGYTRNDALLEQKRIINEKRAKRLQKIVFVPPKR